MIDEEMQKPRNGANLVSDEVAGLGGSGQAAEQNPLLRVDSVTTGYGKKEVLKGVSLSVGLGEIVAVIGHNGAGKSTLFKAIFGILPIWHGQMFIEGEPLASLGPRELLRKGVRYVPQGNRVFSGLSVHENLRLGGITATNRKEQDSGIEHALSFFPALKKRLRQTAGTLSGGERQMLSLAAALVLSPRLLLLDEPSLGLSPPLVVEALDQVSRLNRDSKVGVLVIEQKVMDVLKIAHRVYVLRYGQVTFAGPTETLDKSKLKDVFF